MKEYIGYIVSPCGQVFNKDGTKKSTFMAGKNRGYKYVSLYNSGTKFNISVHRLVALLYIDNPNKYKEVNHIDGNKLNNKVNNLEWCSQKENLNHAQVNGLHHNIKDRVWQYKGDQLVKIHESIRECAKNIGVNESSIRKSCNGMFLVKGYRFYKEVQ